MRDPPRDAAHPAATASRWLRGLGMNALFRPASGGAPKPMVLLLHGLPGSEHNFDLAQAIRRIGRNVLTFTYRGAWGSQGVSRSTTRLPIPRRQSPFRACRRRRRATASIRSGWSCPAVQWAVSLPHGRAHGIPRCLP
ncbi:MAG: alpha/beta hydrolase family protein [Pseudomonadota bacterium]